MKILTISSRGETKVTNNVSHIELEPDDSEMYVKMFYANGGGEIIRAIRAEIVEDGKDIF